ncbi:MAG: four helix bundle protein [Calditrichaeota bacterium]|nr:four helix bundle protein [Calditrichota bacterium]
MNLSADIIFLARAVKFDDVGSHLRKQLIRSLSSIILNYSEALSAESRSDFIHKIKISLKESRESHVCIELMIKVGVLAENSTAKTLSELNEVIAILVKSCQTASKNNSKKN